MSQRNTAFTCLRLAETTVLLRFLVKPLHYLSNATDVPIQNVRRTDVNNNLSEAANMVLQRRLVFDTAVPRGITNGVKGCVKNIVMGTVIPLSQLVLRPLSGLNATGPQGFARGGMQAAVWSPLMFFLAYAAAAQQLVLGLYVSVFAFKAVAIDKKGWNVIDGGYVPYTMKTHPSVENAPTLAVMTEIGADRILRRAKAMEKRSQNPGEDARNATSDDLSNFSFYKKLGLSKTATVREIKEAFSSKALTLHPDTNPSPEAATNFDDLTKAYKVLSKPDRRKIYDSTGDSGVAESGGEMALAKRETMRALLGGKAISELFGEIRTGILSRRYIDELSFKSDEISLLNEKLLEDCPKTLLALLDGFEADGNHDKHWRKDSEATVKELASVGLAPAVLHLAAEEMKYVLAFARQQSPVARVRLWVSHEVIRERRVYIESRVSLINSRKAAGGSGSKKENMDIMMKAVWDFLAPDVSFNVRRIAKRILLDVDAKPEELKRRMEGIDALIALFHKSGTKFAGADEATLTKLQLAMDRARHQR